MTQRRATWTDLFFLAIVCALVSCPGVGCKKSSRPATSSRHATTARQNQQRDSAFLLSALSAGLNQLADEVVLDLAPPLPILDDAKSADGKPVLASCGVTPAVPDGPYNYLAVPAGNAHFRDLGVRRGDVVRYFVLVDQESSEHGIQEVDYIELVVRRLDTTQPQNALIFEGGLTGPVAYPERIEIWRFSDKRTNEIRKRKARYVKKPETLVGWEPSPDESALIQLLERANQWLRNLEAQDTLWQPEPLVAELPPTLRSDPTTGALLTNESLQTGPFAPTEARQLQQAIWHRDIARWAKGDAVAPLDVATALFDWTIRNVQLDAEDPPGYVHQPWQALLYGHGTARHRAWVFAELCRQQQFDVVMLGAGDQWWLPALLLEGELHLFDTRLGLPIPGPGANTEENTEENTNENTNAKPNASPDAIATLSQVLADPSLLRQLDLPDSPYPIADLTEVTAWLVASPLQLGKRAHLLEQALTGEEYVVLAANTRRQLADLKKINGLAELQLWPFPFESMLAEAAMTLPQRHQAAERFEVFALRPRLWKARVLHFQGTRDIPLADRNDPLAQPDLGHRQAIGLYQDRHIRPTDARLQTIEPTKRVLYQAAKQMASYWLGLLSYDLGRYQVAEDWLAQRTLVASPDGPWTAGAHYNLARTYEALDQLEMAARILAEDTSPQRDGNRLRAQQLRAQQLRAQGLRAQGLRSRLTQP